MSAQAYIVVTCWIVFLIVWIISAFGSKRYAMRSGRGFLLRLFAVVIVFLLLSSPTARHYLVGAQLDLLTGTVRWVGVAFAILGLSVLFWARYHLGHNWGMPMSLKHDVELVTTGPYAYVRHPIYSGAILLMIGSALVSVWWALPLILFSAYFIYSAKTEEGIMQKEFPNKYPDYMKRTKMLVPFVL